MRFDHLQIGDKFFHASSLKTAAVFEKKSLSSAYTLHPVTFERVKLESYARPICEFSGAVEVHVFHPLQVVEEQATFLRTGGY